MSQRMIAVFVGGGVILAGLFAVAVAVGWIPTDSSSFHAPRWVIAALGAFFIWAGVVFMTSSPESGGRPPPLVSAVGVTLFAVVFDWLAFGPKAGECTGPTIQLGVLSLTHEESCRLAFGTAAALFDVGALFLWLQGLWQLLR